MTKTRNTLLLLATVALLPLSGCADDASETAAIDNDTANNSREEARDMQRDDHTPEESPVNDRRYGSAYGETEQAGGINGSNRNSTIDDIAAHISLETRYATHDELSALEINTDVREGTAYLSGEVDSEAKRQLAEEVAADVDGIHSLRNDLRVVDDGEQATAGESLAAAADDVRITATVKSRLLASENTGGLDIKVDTDEQVVTLQGDVSDDAERELAGLIAANTSGVKEVRNRLNVKPD